jgi:hypothetical protein
MDDVVLKRIRSEFTFMNVFFGWAYIPIIVMLTEWFVHPEQGALLTFFGIAQLVIGIVLIPLSLFIYYEMYKIQKKYYDFFKYPDYFFGHVKEDEQKSTISGLIRDVVAFNRGYYSSIMLLLILAVGYYLASLTTLLFGAMFGLMDIIIGVIFLVIFTLYISLLAYFGVRLWRGRLVGIKQSEKELAEMLGGSIEA